MSYLLTVGGLNRPLRIHVSVRTLVLCSVLWVYFTAILIRVYTLLLLHSMKSLFTYSEMNYEPL